MNEATRPVRLYLLAGSTGCGKTALYKQHREELERGIAVIDFDALMHEAALTAFPYFIGQDKRWSKGIWESTKEYVDAGGAMVRTVQHLERYRRHAEGRLDHWLLFGYQFADEHWRGVAKRIVEGLTGAKPNAVRLCWLHPPEDVLIEQRKTRAHAHDRIPEEEMRENRTKYQAHMGKQADAKVETVDAAVEDIRRFFVSGPRML